MLIRRALPLWILLGVLASAAALGGYAVVQQVLRSAANHPQMEMAQAAAARLSSGASPGSVVSLTPVDIGSSANPYLIVVDANGSILASSAELGGSPVLPPQGVFAYVRDHGEDVISWQPAQGVRSAIVVDSYRGGYVVTGRSLGWTEQAESGLVLWAMAGWAAAILAAGVLSLVLVRLRDSISR
ncbi:MAG: hypothetical protein ACHQ0J_04180 [Candidatus Dormibacterales bacterium]